MTPVIIGPEVTLFELFGHGYLKNFFAVVGHAKLGTTGEHVAPEKNADLSTQAANAVVMEDFCHCKWLNNRTYR